MDLTKQKIAIGALVGLPAIGVALPWMLTVKRLDRSSLSIGLGLIGFMIGIGVAGILLNKKETDNS